jgi:hypothetical protein
MGMIVSRRGLLEGGLVIAASASTRQAATAQADAELSEAQKITHADAKYQPTPNGQQRCEICCNSSRQTTARSCAARSPPPVRVSTSPRKRMRINFRPRQNDLGRVLRY